MNDYDALVQSIGGIARRLQSIKQRAVREYTPVVESILRAGSLNSHHIERTLDGLLDFSSYESALVLYKRLCRHYWEMDPVATGGYINAYREMWDSEETEEDQVARDTPGRSRRMSFPRYPKYKDSGVEWIGEVPEHWDVTKMKWVAKMESGHTPDKKISEYWENGDIPWVSLNDTSYLKDNDYISDTAYKVTDRGIANSSARLLPPGVVVFSRDATIGRCAITTRPMAVSQHFIAWVCGESLLPEFLLLRLRSMTQELEHLTTGATLKTIGMPDVRTLVTPVPPLGEQRAIVKWVSCETAKIDGLVGEQRRLIELLKEKRQAVISHAVTKGLNPNAPMKPSGIEWLGDVPEHWEVRRLKFLCDVQTGDKDTENAVEDGLYPFFVRSRTVERINSIAFDCEAVLTAGDGVGVGKVFHYHKGPFDFHQRVYMMNNFRDVSGSYLFHFLREEFYKVALEGGAKSTVDSLRRPVFMNFTVCIPPSAEQAAIVTTIEQEAAKFDALTTEAKRTIDLLQERRTALNSAAVTGQIDVGPCAKKEPT